jgi:hypothetical protein
MRFPLLGALLIVVQPPAGVVPLPVPKADPWSELKCDVATPVVLSAGEAKVAQWRLIDEAGAYLTVVPESNCAVFIALKPGRYRFAAIADGKAEWYAMTAGESVPPPPPPPGPVDSFVVKLQAAYAADAGLTKAADLKQLIGLYLESIDFAKKSDFATASDLFAAVSAAATHLLPPDSNGVRKLAGVRALVAQDLGGILPTDPDAPLTDQVRGAAAAAFAKYAAALQRVVP